MAPRVLFLVNDPIAPPALLGEVFAEHGCDVTEFAVVTAEQVADPAREVTFPDTTDYQVVVALGARWSVYDPTLTATWAGAEMSLLRDADAAGVAVLGVCFGAQLLAQAYGGSVAASPRPEVGWYHVDSDDPALVPRGPWFQWHYDRFTVPAGARRVAVNDNAPQAFLLGRSLGLQFHPELNPELLEAWLAHDGAEARALGVDIDAVRAHTAEHGDDARQRLSDLVGGVLDLLVTSPHDR